MFKTNPFGRLFFLASATFLVLMFFWIACTQKTPIDPTRSLQDDVFLLINISASPSQIATGGAQSAVRVQLVDEEGQPLVNETVSFTTNLGEITSQTTTDGDGWAQTVLTSGVDPGEAQITASYGEQASVMVSVTIVSPFEAQMLITAASSSILADGIDATTVTVTLMGDSAQPVVGETVLFSATEGTITSPVLTNTDGEATATLTGPASNEDLVTSVTATYDSLVVSTIVTFRGIVFTAEADPTTVLADGESTSRIRAILKEATNHVAVSDADITFSTDLGLIPNHQQTNDQGVADVFLTSGETQGTAHVVAYYGDFSTDTVEVTFLPSIPANLEVTTTPPVIPADGVTESIIKATVTDATQSPVPDGIPVNFTIIEGAGGSIVNQKTTSGGVASSALTSTTPGTIRVRVSVADLADTVQVVCTVGAVSQILVSSDLDSMMADGIETATIQSTVMDGQGNPVPDVTVHFSASIGDITQMAPTNAQGVAVAQYSSSQVGTATITATVGEVTGVTIIRLLPGGPNSIVLGFDPTSIGVQGTGKVQTAIVEAEVRDSKNNPVVDGTEVRFSILAGPGGGERLSSTDAIPTVGGIARVSLSSGTVSGNVRVQAEVLDDGGNPVLAVASEILIHAGEAYIEDINDVSTTHLTVAANRLNIWAVLDTTEVSIMVLDKYNNPVQEGTAVYLTASGGGVNTHTAYTDAYGKASVILTAGNPQPTIDRFYNYEGMQDPNLDTVIPGYVYYPDVDQTLIPNYDAYPDAYYPGTVGGRILNTEGDFQENDGIARIVAYTEGQDANGDPARAWDWLSVVYSGSIAVFEDNSETTLPDTLSMGESATVRICIMDGNGNPIASGSKITAAIVPEEAQARLSWTEEITGRGQGTSYYYITISNAINVDDPKPGYASIKISVESINGEGSITTNSVYIGI